MWADSELPGSKTGTSFRVLGLPTPKSLLKSIVSQGKSRQVLGQIILSPSWFLLGDTGSQCPLSLWLCHVLASGVP